MPSSAIVLVGRILLAVIFILAALSKFGNMAGTTGYFTGLGLPMPGLMTWVTPLFELGAGLCILVGFHTRIAAYLLAAFSVVAAFVGHYGHGGDDAVLVMMHMQALMKDIAIAGGLLVLGVYGPGSLSIDAKRA